MIKDFSQVMSERTDQQLVEIVTVKRDEYQPEALISAEKELLKRQIDPLSYNSGNENETISKDQPIYKEQMPLEKIQIVFTILLPALFITAWSLFFGLVSDLNVLKGLGFPAITILYFGIHKWLKDNGYQRKATEFVRWTTITVFIYIGIILVAGLGIYFFTE